MRKHGESGEQRGARRIHLDGLAIEQEVAIPVRYKGIRVEASCRADLIVNREVLVELKTVDEFAPVHVAQVLTCLRHCELRVGLLINFNASSLMRGVRRLTRD